MKIYRSWFGYALAVAYAIAAVYFVHFELTHTAGGWINLSGLGVALVTLPSQWTFGLLFDTLGLRTNFSDLKPFDYVLIGFHVLVTAGVVYLIGYGIDRGVRWIVASVKAPQKSI